METEITKSEYGKFFAKYGAVHRKSIHSDLLSYIRKTKGGVTFVFNKQTLGGKNVISATEVHPGSSEVIFSLIEFYNLADLEQLLDRSRLIKGLKIAQWDTSQSG